MTAISADLQDQAARGLQLTDYDISANLVLPDLDGRKGTTLAFNATTGAAEAGPTISDVQSVADAAADIQTLAHIEDGTDATDAIQTVAGVASPGWRRTSPQSRVLLRTSRLLRVYHPMLQLLLGTQQT